MGYPTVAEAEAVIAKWLGLYPLPSNGARLNPDQPYGGDDG